MPPAPNDRNTSEAFSEFEAQLDEIRRHKWIESQRSGEDIGFERALTEWVCAHGEDWRASRKKAEKKKGK